MASGSRRLPPRQHRAPRSVHCSRNIECEHFTVKVSTRCPLNFEQRTSVRLAALADKGTTQRLDHLRIAIARCSVAPARHICRAPTLEGRRHACSGPPTDRAPAPANYALRSAMNSCDQCRRASACAAPANCWRCANARRRRAVSNHDACTSRRFNAVHLDGAEQIERRVCRSAPATVSTRGQSGHARRGKLSLCHRRCRVQHADRIDGETATG